MASTFKGYYPELGKKFMEESNELVIGRARSSQKKSEEEAIEEAEAEAIEKYSQEHGRAPDAQQLHDWMTSNSAPTGMEEDEDEEGAARANLQRQAQVRKMVDDSIKRSQGIPTGPSMAPPDPTHQ